MFTLYYGLDNLPLARSGAAACTDGRSKIYVIGGITNRVSWLKQEDKGNFVQYDVHTGEWSYLPDLPQMGCLGGAVFYQDKIYYIANTMPAGHLNQCYDLAAGNWSEKASSPVTIEGHSISLVNDKIYLIGRSGSNAETKGHLYIYDITNDSWSEGAPMLENLRLHSAAALSDKIFIIGGSHYNDIPSDSCFLYDTVNNSWTSLPNLPHFLRRATAQVLDGKIIVVGGDSSVGLNNSNLVYNPQIDRWEQNSIKFSVPRTNPASVVIDNTMICFGGYDDHASSNTVEACAFLYKDQIDRYKEKLATFKGVYKINTKDESFIGILTIHADEDNNVRVSFDGKTIPGILFDNATNRLIWDNSKTSASLTFSHDESGNKRLRGKFQLPGAKEVPVIGHYTGLPEILISQQLMIADGSKKPTNFLIRFNTSDVVRAGYSGVVTLQIKFKYQMKDASIKEAFSKPFIYPIEDFKRAKICSQYAWVKDSDGIGTYVLREFIGIEIQTESSWYGDQWHIDSFVVYDLIMNKGYSFNVGNGDFAHDQWLHLIPIVGEIAGWIDPTTISDKRLSGNYVVPYEATYHKDFSPLIPDLKIHDGYAVVYVWAFRGITVAWGHASMALSDGTYISWWPQGEDRQPILPLKLEELVRAHAGTTGPYEAPAYQDMTFAGDLAGEDNIRPDVIITLTGLDESAIKTWWEAFKGDSNNKWNALTQNCSTVIFQALANGVGPKITEYQNAAMTFFGSLSPWLPHYIEYLARCIANDRRAREDLITSSLPSQEVTAQTIFFAHNPTKAKDPTSSVAEDAYCSAPGQSL